MRARLLGHSGEVDRNRLAHASGAMIPVELVARPVTFANQPRHAIAVRDLRARKKAEADLRLLAHHDALTGLPNRRSFNSKLDREIAAAAANGGSLAVLCLDLDRFKEVNDLFGHAAGDTLLQSVARCTAAVLEPDQMLARLGGDEFAIIAPGLPDPAAAGRIAESIIDAFRAENEDAPNGGLISSSIGIAIYPERRDRSPEPDEPRRHRALSRQGRGPRHLSLLRGGDGRRGQGAPAYRARPAARRLARRVAPCLPAAEAPDHRRGHRLRGAAALAPCRARRHLAQHLHPDRRGERPDPADRRMGAAHRLPRGGELGAPADRRGQRLGGAASLRAILAPGARDPAADRTCPRIGWSSRSPRRRWSAT